jgi:hypothetical protein
MYCLPSGFTLVQICKAITNPFYLLYLLPYFKLPVLLPTWDLKQKKYKSVLPDTPSYLDMGWVKIEKQIWDMIHRPTQMLEVQSDPAAAGVAATPPMATPADAGNQIIRTRSPTRPVVSDVAVADLGLGALEDTADRNRPEATDTRLERGKAGVTGPRDDLMIVPPEETPHASPQSAPHGDNDVLEHENPPAAQHEVRLVHQAECDAVLPFPSPLASVDPYTYHLQQQRRRVRGPIRRTSNPADLQPAQQSGRNLVDQHMRESHF